MHAPRAGIPSCGPTSSSGSMSLRTRPLGGESTAPFLIAGDFNMPADSTIYRRCWSTFTNVFSGAGFGFGHTKFTQWLVSGSTTSSSAPAGDLAIAGLAPMSAPTTDPSSPISNGLHLSTEKSFDFPPRTAR